jgi:hypothetical protein
LALSNQPTKSREANMPERNRPSPEGYALGKEIARLCDQEEAKQAKMLRPTIPERCRTCAFRGGTIPNGCGATLLDAMHCIIEGLDFHCHEHGRTDQLCAGFQMMKIETHRPVDWPWFTTDDPQPRSTDEGTPDGRPSSVANEKEQ